MKIQLSISLLASNRVASLEKCLDSLRPLLMQVPSELIVVFTGTDQRVREVASRYTDRILPFTWCDNFSAARNVGLWAAKGEWFMYIDDDEWFEDVTEIRDFFLSGEYLKYGSAFYKQKNFLDWDGIQYSDYHAFRMTRIVPGIAFQNMVHEELVPYMTPSKYFDTYVNHYGYIKEAGKKTSEKPLRNIPLLLRNIQERPSYVKNYIQITQEYIIMKNWEKAEEYCRKGRALCKGYDDNYYRSWLQVNLLYLLCVKEEYEKAEQEAIHILEKEHPWEIVQLYIYQTLLVIYPGRKDNEKTVHYGQKFEETFTYMEEHPELWRTQAYGDLTEEYIKFPPRLYLIRSNCTEAALKLGDTALAVCFFKLLPWEDETWMQKYYPVLDRWKDSYRDFFGELLANISECSPYRQLQEAIAVESDQVESKEYHRLFVQCIANTGSAYLRNQAVKEAILHQMDLAEIVSVMDLEAWKECAGKIQELNAADESPKLQAAAEALAQKAPIYGLWLKKLLYEKELMQGYLTGIAMHLTIKEYSRNVLQFYKLQYQEELFHVEKRILLPKDCRFALFVSEALEKMENREFPEAVRLFRKALQFNPGMTGVIREMIRLLSAKAATPVQNMGEEFQMLAKQMKEALHGMIDQKQFAEALPIIQQLSPLLSEDLELLRMRQQVLRELSE